MPIADVEKILSEIREQLEDPDFNQFVCLFCGPDHVGHTTRDMNNQKFVKLLARFLCSGVTEHNRLAAIEIANHLQHEIMQL